MPDEPRLPYMCGVCGLIIPHWETAQRHADTEHPYLATPLEQVGLWAEDEAVS